MREVKKKVLVIIVALMAVAMLATPIVGTAQALGKPNVGEIFYLDPESDPATLTGITEITPPTEKWIGPDDLFRHSTGAYREINYAGVLGEGVLTMETVFGLGKSELVPGGMYAEGDGTYRITLEITTDGGYGTGKLEGMLRLSYETMLVPPPYFSWDEWWTLSLHGKGDLKGLNVFVEGYATVEFMVGYSVWWTSTTIMS